MRPSVSPEFIAAFDAQETQEICIYLIEISHPDMEATRYLANVPYEPLPNGWRGVVHQGQEYVFIPLNLVPPAQEDGLVQRARLTIDNITREVLADIRMAGYAPPRVVIKAVLSSHVDYVEIETPELMIRNVEADLHEVACEIYPEMLSEEEAPYNTFNQADFPGVFGGV